MLRIRRISSLFPYTTLFRSCVWLCTARCSCPAFCKCCAVLPPAKSLRGHHARHASRRRRSEEHTSELQSRGHLVCRLLLEKKKPNKYPIPPFSGHPATHKLT